MVEINIEDDLKAVDDRFLIWLYEKIKKEIDKRNLEC